MKKDEFLNTYKLNNKFINIYEEILSRKKIRKTLEECLNILSKKKDDLLYLDIGCGTGERTLLFKEYFKSNNMKTFGVDINKNNLKKAEKLGINTIHLNIENEVPPITADLISCFEIIEHIYDTDAFLKNILQTLNKNGCLLISTPNTVNWKNRIAMIAGIPPLNLEVSLHDYYGLKMFKKSYDEFSPAGHIRGFTPNSLREMLESHGLTVLSIWGLENWKMKVILNYFPNLTTNFLIIAKRS